MTSMAFSPDGHTLAGASADETARLWDLATRRPIGTPPAGHAGSVNSVAFSRDGHTLAGGDEDNAVRLGNVSVPDHLEAWRAGGGALVAAVFVRSAHCPNA
ncbi:hypothetical protein Ssi02_07160 [Sinosporangium siamense]|uniref:WD domain-containing protein, G-beta repeat-containing protein n=1 Tax=Sinosporangium siamense TaxID=1367973 RepID=A0A919RCY6_9ACTN|nr:hypothetical protein Ssi02_07160 [Sinosporangium siamense]